MMDTLDEFMLFNAMEDAREKMERDEEESKRDYSFDSPWDSDSMDDSNED